jgi:hypothetical protein
VRQKWNERKSLPRPPFWLIINKIRADNVFPVRFSIYGFRGNGRSVRVASLGTAFLGRCLFNDQSSGRTRGAGISPEPRDGREHLAMLDHAFLS